MTSRISLKEAGKLFDPLRSTGRMPTTGKKAKAQKSRALDPADLEDTAQQAFVKWADLAIKAPARYWFVPNGLGKLGRFMAGWAKKMGLKPGISDIHVIWPGAYGVIEFKSKTGELSGYQEQFLSDVKACGHYQGVARSVEEAERLLRAWGCPLSASVIGRSDREAA